jgi:aspartate racemase
MTAHYYHQHLQPVFNGTLLNVVDMIAKELTDNSRYSDKQRIGLIGSSGLLSSGMLQQRLSAAGFECLTLNESEQEAYFMRPIYMSGGIKSGVLNGEPQMLFLKQIDILMNKGAEIILGACSEVPLIYRDITAALYIDAFELLAKRTVEYCYHK